MAPRKKGPGPSRQSLLVLNSDTHTSKDNMASRNKRPGPSRSRQIPGGISFPTRNESQRGKATSAFGPAPSRTTRSTKRNAASSIASWTSECYTHKKRLRLTDALPHDDVSQLSFGSPIFPLLSFPHTTTLNSPRTLSSHGQFPLMSLPTELRLLTFNRLFARRDSHEVRDLAGAQPALMLTSRLIRLEAAESFYGNGTIYFGVMDRHDKSLSGRTTFNGNLKRCYMQRFRNYVENLPIAMRFVRELRFRIDPCTVCIPVSEVCTACVGAEASFDRSQIDHLPKFPCCNFAPLFKFSFLYPHINLYLESSHWLLHPSASRIKVRSTPAQFRAHVYQVDWLRLHSFMAQDCWRDALLNNHITGLHLSGHRAYLDAEQMHNRISSAHRLPLAPRANTTLYHLDIAHVVLSTLFTSTFPSSARLQSHFDSFVLPLRFSLQVPPTHRSAGYALYVEAGEEIQWTDWRGIKTKKLGSVQRMRCRRWVPREWAGVRAEIAERVRGVGFTGREMWSVPGYLRVREVEEEDPDV